MAQVKSCKKRGKQLSLQSIASSNSSSTTSEYSDSKFECSSKVDIKGLKDSLQRRSKRLKKIPQENSNKEVDTSFKQLLKPMRIVRAKVSKERGKDLTSEKSSLGANAVKKDYKKSNRYAKSTPLTKVDDNFDEKRVSELKRHNNLEAESPKKSRKLSKSTLSSKEVKSKGCGGLADENLGRNVKPYATRCKRKAVNTEEVDDIVQQKRLTKKQSVSANSQKTAKLAETVNTKSSKNNFKTPKRNVQNASEYDSQTIKESSNCDSDSDIRLGNVESPSTEAGNGAQETASQTRKRSEKRRCSVKTKCYRESADEDDSDKDSDFEPSAHVSDLELDGEDSDFEPAVEIAIASEEVGSRNPKLEKKVKGSSSTLNPKKSRSLQAKKAVKTNSSRAKKKQSGKLGGSTASASGSKFPNADEIESSSDDGGDWEEVEGKFIYVVIPVGFTVC